jgi:hypothetical protein
MCVKFIDVSQFISPIKLLDPVERYQVNVTHALLRVGNFKILIDVILNQMYHYDRNETDQKCMMITLTTTTTWSVGVGIGCRITTIRITLCR